MAEVGAAVLNKKEQEGLGMAASVYLDIDISELRETIKGLKAFHNEKTFDQIMYRVFKRTGGSVRKIMKEELPKDYAVKPSWIGKQVQAPQMTAGSGGTKVGCVIPIEGTRGIIGQNFKASATNVVRVKNKAGRRPKGSPKRRRRLKGRKVYRIAATIVNSGQSVLPEAMKNQGGYPPFFPGGKPSKKVVYTKHNGKMVRVVGLNVPRMPFNRSQDKVQKRILETMMARMEQEHKAVLKRYVK